MIYLLDAHLKIIIDRALGNIVINTRSIRIKEILYCLVNGTSDHNSSIIISDKISGLVLSCFTQETLDRDLHKLRLQTAQTKFDIDDV